MCVVFGKVKKPAACAHFTRWCFFVYFPLQLYERELDLLYYSLSSARIFFRADLSSAEEAAAEKEAAADPAATAAAAAAAPEPQTAAAPAPAAGGAPPPPPPPPPPF